MNQKKKSKPYQEQPITISIKTPKETYILNETQTLLVIGFLGLRNEILQKQLQELENENLELLQELEEIDNSDNKTNSIISGVMEQFKQDPQATISFATELINGFLKPKANAEN